MKKLLFSIFVTLITQTAEAQFGRFVSYDFNVHLAAMDNYQYGTRTRPDRLHWGVGAGFGTSINDDFNLLIGVDWMTVNPNNTRSDYELCNSPSCLPEVKSQQIFIPIGFEYYTNTDRSTFQSFFNVHLIPSFSLSETRNITPFDSMHVAQAPYTEKSGFGFQDLNLKIGLNNEFGLNENLKIYVEPSVRHSLLFRSEDVVNPDWTISLKIGIRYRKQAS